MKDKCVYFEIDQIPKQNLKYKIMDIFNIFEKREYEQKIVYKLYKSNNNYIKKINSKINKINVPIVLAKEIKENAKKEEYQHTKLYRIIKSLEEDKTIFAEFIEEILKNTIEEQKQTAERQSIYVLAKENNFQRENKIKNLLSKYKAVNIITSNIREFKKLEENMEESSETFAVLNNKKKSLARAQYIINMDFNEEELLKYNINRTANIFNLNIGKLHLNNFDGCIINNIEINNDNQEYDIKDLYLTSMINEVEIENIIKSGKYKLIGNNGYIFLEKNVKELVKIFPL